MSVGGERDVVMFDDAVADGWAPFALTRPVGELRFGRWRLRQRLERVVGTPVSGHLTRPWLARFAEPAGAPALDPAALAPVARLYWSSRAVPALAVAVPTGAANLWIDDRLAGVTLGAGGEPPDRGWCASPTPLPDLPDAALAGTWLERAWDIAAHGPDRLDADLRASLEPGSLELPPGVWRLGDAPLSLAPDVELEPGVVLDTRTGPIELGPDVRVRAGARLAGPLYAGTRSRLLGGSLSALSAGPYSFLRGEIEHTTILGCTNKAHDGFLGHAVLGSWVNLGAMTTNSDLKNTYGTIRVGPPGEEIDSGLMKLGCLIGDHAKTGIGTLLDTGTVVGAGSNLFGSEMPAKWVPPFSWGRGNDLMAYRRDAFRDTAAKVMSRRGLPVDEGTRSFLEDIWDAASP